MTPQELKNSILQRAIEGRLVEQRAEEGTGAELFDKIQKEKKELIREGKIKKQKSLEEIKKDEVPFEIPKTWKWVRVGTIFQHNTGKALNRVNREGIKLEYITTSNLYWDRFELDNLKKMYFKETEFQKCSVMKGDLLVCEGGDVGRAAIWENESSVMIQNHIHRLRAYYSICTRFFYYLFYLYKNIGLIGGKGIGIKGLSTRALGSIVFPLPPLAEQKRIVEKIEELMPLVDEYEENWQKLEEFNQRFPEDMKKSLLQEAIKGKLVEQRKEEGTGTELFGKIQKEKKELIKEGKIKKQKPLPEITEDEIPFDIPETWKWVRLGEISTIARGGSPRPIKDYITLDDDGINWIKIGDTEKNSKYINSTMEKIKPEGLKKSRLVKPGDFLLTNSMSYGRPYILNIEGCIHDGWLVIIQDISAYNKDFLYWMLSSGYAFNQFSRRVSGAVVKNLNSDKVSESIFPLPPLAEQKRIVDRLEELLPLCDKLIKNKEK